MIIKNIVQRILGDPTLGMLDYYRFPERREAWGGPFNGQVRRQELFCALVEAIKPAAIVETGTYLGTTTEFMARFGVPTYSIEGHPRHFGFARARMLCQPHVRIQHGDSRAGLRSLFAGPLASLKGRSIFAYLDAHWNADLPLAEELEIIFNNCPSAVAMVDDFQVPGDAGYSYDDYGAGNALTASYVAPVAKACGLALFYPAAASAEESGKRRGCVVLARAAVHGTLLTALPLLHPAAAE